MPRKILLLISTMKGGGAERVAALLLNRFHSAGYECEYMLTSCRTEDAVKRDLYDDIPLTSLQDDIEKLRFTDKVKSMIASSVCKPCEKAKIKTPAFFVDMSFKAQYGREIKKLHDKLSNEPDTICISFLQPSTPILMFAAKDLPNKVIFSERADPYRLMKHRYGRAFIADHYRRADAAVFQTEEAKNAYPDIISNKGTVIPNPVKDDLPTPYEGKRNKTFVTFCRISKQKNLNVALDAFKMLLNDHPDYKLEIIGDAVNEEGAKVLTELNGRISEFPEGTIIMTPFMTNIHEHVKDAFCYINSSDYEGISNAMLEAMAIGLPCICTDCPIGGAKQTITNGENGLLIPVRDSEALYSAMKKLIKDRDLAARLGKNAQKVREDYNIDAIASKWLKIIEK